MRAHSALSPFRLFVLHTGCRCRFVAVYAVLALHGGFGAMRAVPPHDSAALAICRQYGDTPRTHLEMNHVH